MIMKTLFENCAYKGGWTTINDVDFKFIENDDKLEIYFMGSYQLKDWVLNFLFTKKLYKQFRVHRGFYKAYSQVRNLILDKIYNNEYKKIIVVGYSHGGALCQLCLEDLVYHFPTIDIIGYAFETPRCLKVPKQYRYMWNNLITTECNNDIVCHCPPKLFGYDELGTKIQLMGDVNLVQNNLPNFIKSHYPNVVLDGLKKIERNQEL